LDLGHFSLFKVVSLRLLAACRGKNIAPYLSAGAIITAIIGLDFAS